MKKTLTIVLLGTLLLSCRNSSLETSSNPENGCFGLAEPIQNVLSRQVQSLDGDWKAFIDQYETGYYDYRRKPMDDGSTFFADRSFNQDRTKLIEYDFDTAGSLRVPGDWNTQRPELYLYEGTIWYRQKFDAEPREGTRTFLHFGAANYEAVVGVNGHPVAKHTGGYTPFDIEITDKLVSGSNTVIVKVDNSRRLENVPTVNFDWWNYGGITRSVSVVSVPQTFIRDYSVQLSPDRTAVCGWVQLDGPALNQGVRLEIAELGITAELSPDSKGRAEFSIPASVQCWTPSEPKLYAVRLTSGADSVEDSIGFRTISTRGSEILLNGEPIFLKGICIHEESPNPSKGRACTVAEAEETLGWVKALGCNFVRLAHYPHNENMVRAAERLGILVWDEIPVYWTIQWENPDTYANAEHQLDEMISRDRNRANVIIWSVANETPHGGPRLSFLSKLIARARELDPTRLVSSAMEKSYSPDDPLKLTVDDDLMSLTDVISFNQYVGWYDGDIDKCARVSWSFPVEKPVIITEFGGGAKYGFHGKDNERFTEEYQAKLFEANLAMMDKIPGLAGATPWILKDFRSPKRFLPEIQDDYNRKGLVSEKGELKQAFGVYGNWRSE